MRYLFLLPLILLCIASVLVNMWTLDWDDVLAAGSVGAVASLLFAFFELRERKARSRWHERLDQLEGLEHCPLPHDQLGELFTWLDRPNPPACTNRFVETAQFLHEQSLPVDSTIDWLQANGAGCDCEVIYNTADRYGKKIGFEPIQSETDD